MNQIALSGLMALLLSPTVAVASAVTLSQPAATTQTQATRISEPAIRSILEATQSATEQKDVKAILKYVAADATIDLTIDAPFVGSQNFQLSRQQYQRFLQEGFAATKMYRGKLSNLNVKIAADGKSATATYTLIEETTLVDQPATIASTGTETITFKLINGEILATAIQATSKLDIQGLDVQPK